MIANCPNCANALVENNKLAQGVKECPYCEGRFFILETKKPKELFWCNDEAVDIASESFPAIRCKEQCDKFK